VGEQDAGKTFELKEDQIAADCESVRPQTARRESSNFFFHYIDSYDQLQGIPCSIQLFTTTLRDEECLQMAKQIDQCLKNSTQEPVKRVSNI
jgi:amidase